ncbi:uncharacterized protein ARMOST_18516 [Armillaria ostoyae]|uniref:Uncharacterized protein n=1 Tax=Armillaria ostoyae TaxID=47428 RepID=A0A284S228_ARMOS|nr:uncharacterized protein ARMOST_18516 [Armillaria ostoyae]
MKISNSTSVHLSYTNESQEAVQRHEPKTIQKLACGADSDKPAQH